MWGKCGKCENFEKGWGQRGIGAQGFADFEFLSSVCIVGVWWLRFLVRFLRDDDDMEINYFNQSNEEYGLMLAKKYYAKLYKEYVIVDLTYWKIGKIGCRWQTRADITARKGLEVCGETNCEGPRGLMTFEFNFGYRENMEPKNCLTKVKLCPECGWKFNYRSHVEEAELKFLRDQEEKQKTHSKYFAN